MKRTIKRSNLRVEEIISSVGYWNGKYTNDYLDVILLAGLEAAVRCTWTKTYFCKKSIGSLQRFLLYLIHSVIDVQWEYELHIINHKDIFFVCITRKSFIARQSSILWFLHQQQKIVITFVIKKLNASFVEEFFSNKYIKLIFFSVSDVDTHNY